MAYIEPDYKALFEATPGLLLVVDPAFDVVALTDTYLRTIAATREESVGRPIFDVLAIGGRDNVGYRDRLRRSLKRVRESGLPDTMVTERFDLPRAGEDGGGWVERYWSSRNSPVLDEGGRLRYIIRRIEDVTEFVQLRNDLEDEPAHTELAHTELEKRIVEMGAEIIARSGELESANQLLHEASEAKNEFLSRMSHELRTPLAAILGFSELLGMQQDLDDVTRHRVETIEAAGQHLLTLVTDVLDISRIESGEFTVSIEAVPVAPVLHDSLVLMRAYADKTGILLADAVVANDCDYVLADTGRLKQVLINLLSNAVKYNREAGEVRVSVATAPDRPTNGRPARSARRIARISVSDTGPGLDEASLRKLFVPFERLAAAATGVEGTGLGLALSRSLVEGMGGTLGVDSTVGEGSTFWIELEAVKPRTVDSLAHGSAATPRDYGTERTVLYVEDTAENVQLMQGILESRPRVRLTSASEGLVGIELAREHHPDLIVLDLHLPDLPGARVLEILRDDEITQHIPVVILTADTTKHHRDQLLESGAQEYLTKPIGANELLGIIDRFLEPN